MPPVPQLPHTESPLDALRRGIDAHRQTVEAAKQVGADVQAAKAPEPAPPEAA